MAEGKTDRMKDRGVAIIFPGIGYHKDKPLLYYSAKLAASKGFEVISVEYHDMPQKIRGNAEMMEKAAQIAFEQTKEQLKSAQLSGHNKLLFIGKSIGTVAMAHYVSEEKLNLCFPRGTTEIKQIWYTPVEATFLYETGKAVAFIGDADPWSDVAEVKRMAEQHRIRLYSYPGCNHSLEGDDFDRNMEILRDVMNKTGEFIDG